MPLSGFFISLGEALTGVLSTSMGIFMLYAAAVAPKPEQRRLRLWVGVYCSVMGLEEIVDALFLEGDAIAIPAQAICTVIQLVTSAGAVWYLSKISRSRWARRQP